MTGVPRSDEEPPAWLRAAAKVSLHDHLDGSVRPETLLDLAASQGGVRLPFSTAEELRSWVRSRHGSLERYLEPFSVVNPLLQDADSLRRIAEEYVADAAADGVVHAEVRWAPRAHTAGGFRMEDALEAVSAGLSDGVRKQRAGGTLIDVTQILCVLRGLESGHEVARLAVRHRDRGVVAVDLAGDEARHPVREYVDVFSSLAAECMPVTIHAGEAAGVLSIKEALLDGRAVRIGHGVRITDDIRMTEGRPQLGRVAAWVRDRATPLETSPSSNIHTGAVPADLRRHPLEKLRALGFTVTVNTDNRLMSDTTLTNELNRVRRAFGYDRRAIGELLLAAARGAFLSPQARDALATRIVTSLDHDLEEQ